MKKILFSCLLALIIVFPAAAQQLGLEGGINFAKISTHGSGINFNSTALTSFHAGLVLDASLGDGFYLQPRLLLSGEGGKYADEVDKAEFKPYYLKLPVDLIYKVKMEGGELFGGLGPYAALGLFGNYVENGHKTKLNYGNSPDDDLKRTDFGADFIIGYELNNGVFLDAGYSLGFSDIAPANNTNYKTKNMLFGISVGYFIKQSASY